MRLERVIGVDRAARVRRSAVRILVRTNSVPVLRPIGERALRRLFDRLAPAWNAIRDDPVYLDAFNRALDELPRRFPEMPPPSTVLDVGCGTGLATRALVERFPGAEVTGLDIAPEMVRRARAEVDGARFVVGSASDLPFANRSFDLVTALDGVFDAAELARVYSGMGAIVIVYSRGGEIPVSRPLDQLTAEFVAAGLRCEYDDASAWILWARRVPTRSA